MANYKKEDIASAGRLAVKVAGGQKNLANYVSFLMDHRSDTTMLGDFIRAAKKFANENILIYKQDRRAWLNRRGIVYKDVDNAFTDIFGQAIREVVVAYMKKHNLAFSRIDKRFYKIVKKG